MGRAAEGSWVQWVQRGPLSRAGFCNVFFRLSFRTGITMTKIPEEDRRAPTNWGSARKLVPGRSTAFMRAGGKGTEGAVQAGVRPHPSRPG